ncbi:hypothetical protein PV326_012366 [Microctonus aethiopoides]|nr:hypothetical protein PV326_012366 [Microctonus aethiopoides]
MSDLTLRRKHRVFDLDYWERSMKKYSALVRKLRMGSRGWERRVHMLTSEEEVFLMEYPPVRMRCDEMVIRNKRDIRRRVAGSVMKSLSCSRLDGDHFFDHLGILWMHLGCWGEDHPVENLNSPFWNKEGAIYIFYESKEKK